MDSLYRILFYLSLVTLFAKSAVGQSVRVSVWRDTITTAAGTTFTNRLTVSSTTKQHLEVLIRAPSSLQLLSTTPRPLHLIAGESGIIPVKGLVGRQLASPANEVVVQVNDSIGRLLKEVSFLVMVPQKPQVAVSLYNPDQTIILYSGTETAHLPLRLIHHKNRRETVFLQLISLPAGADKKSFPLPVVLGPDQDTTISVLVKPSRYWSASTPYQFVVTVRDSLGTESGNVIYKVVVAAASKRFSKADPNSDGAYGASVAFTKLSNNHWTREGRIWGRDSVGKARVDFQVHYLDYASDHFQQLQNSFISFRTERTAIRFGSQYDYHELPLYGQGLKVSHAQDNQQWTVWAVNASSNWLDKTAFISGGNTFSVRYDRQISSLSGSTWSLSSSYFTQSVNDRAGYLNFASFRFDRPDHHLLEVLAGQSAESSRQGTDRAKTVGWAGQLNYTYQSPALSWQMRAYVSSPVYSGFQKGATIVNGNLAWQPRARLMLVTRLSHVYYNQILFSLVGDRFRSMFGTTIAELGLRYTARRVVVGLRPYWYSQTDFTNQFSSQANSYRLSPSVSYFRRSNLRFDLSYDIGTFYSQSASLRNTGFLSQRVTAFVAAGPFSVGGYWQRGPYYLNDLRDESPADITRTSITPLLDFRLFDRRLIGSAGLNLLYNAFTRASQALAVGRIRYDITPTLWIRLEGNETPYAQQKELAVSQYRMEVTKLFTQLAVGARGRLRLHFFSDANGNGSREPGETWMDSLLVTVDDNTLMTNAKGTITYQNLPPGGHTVSAISAGQLGDPVQYFEKIVVGSAIDRVIPIRKTFRVKGILHCRQSTYDSKPCEFSRFSIDVKRGDEVLSSTIPLPDGTFSVHLLPGPYTLLVRDNLRQAQATIKTTSFVLGDGGQHPVFDWMIDGSTRSVEIKRFKSN